MDDRFVEFVKLFLRVQASKEERKLSGELLFGGVARDAKGEEAIIFEHLDKENSGAFSIRRAVYQNMVDSFRARFPVPELGKWLRIDRAFAEALACKLL